MTVTYNELRMKALELINKRSDKISQLNIDRNWALEIDSLEAELPAKRRIKKKRMTEELVIAGGN